MAGALVLIALIAAGVYTENSGFYWAAGILTGLVVLFQILVIGVARKAFKSVNRELDSFDSFTTTRNLRRGDRRSPFDRF